MSNIDSQDSAGSIAVIGTARRFPDARDLDGFDAAFFGLTPREAALLDPQDRALLECCWHTFEDAGYDPLTCQSVVGVFACACSDNPGAHAGFLARRVACKLNLRGPACTLGAQCERSLAVVSQACQALQNYQCGMALAGATAFGDGGGVVLLKRLEDATADGDHIYAVIPGCGINLDGSTKDPATGALDLIQSVFSLHRHTVGTGGADEPIAIEQPDAPTRPSKWTNHLVILSARTELALQRSAANLADYLADHPELDPADIAFTLMNGRHAFDVRRIAVCTDLCDTSTELARPTRCKTGSRAGRGTSARIAFMFPGQDSLHLNMGCRLRELNPVFRWQFDRCAEIATRHGSPDLRALVYHGGGRGPGSAIDVASAQPAIFAVEYALAQMWNSLGIVPSMMLGHGVGEFAAACMAGVFGLEDALALIVLRGRLMASMAGVADTVEPIVREFRDAFSRVTLSAPLVPFISSFTGERVSADDATSPHYWAIQLRQPTRISDAIARLRAESYSMLEVGPGNRLTTLALHQNLSVQAGEHDGLIVNSMPPAYDLPHEERCFLNALGRLWLHGANPLWTELCPGEPRSRVSLPGYPFERQRRRISRRADTDAMIDA